MKPLKQAVLLMILLSMALTPGMSNAENATHPQPPASVQVEGDLQQQREAEVTLPEGTLDDAIQAVQSKGLMKGDVDSRFHAERPVTRAELATILVKTFRLNERKPPQLHKVALKDVPANYWAAADIKTVVEQGVMTGYRENYFYPNQPMTRGEALAIFAQAYGVQQLSDKTVDTILSRYPDSPQVPDWGRKAMATSLKNGFVDAMPAQQIRPQQLMTRGAMAFTLNQYLKRLNPTEQQLLP